MSYEEFKNIVSLLQSPDEEVVELGRQLFPIHPGWHMYGYKNMTELMHNGRTYTFFMYTIPPSESEIKQLYASIFRI